MWGARLTAAWKKALACKRKKPTLIEKMLKGLYECGQLIVGIKDYKFPLYAFMIGELQACS